MHHIYTKKKFLLFSLPMFLAFTLLTDKLLGVSIINTLKMAAINLILTLPLSFFLAYLLRQTSKKNTVYKTILFAPYVIPGAIAGLIWLFMLDPVSGLINSVLRSIGLDALALQWIGGKNLSPCFGERSLPLLFLFSQELLKSMSMSTSLQEGDPITTRNPLCPTCTQQPFRINSMDTEWQ